MKLYNSLGRELQELKPLDDMHVRLYSCGPTVYDRVHLGNFRTYIFEDLLRRALAAEGLKLSHVMNITDVDDKTIARSREVYPTKPPKAALVQLTRHYEELFLNDAKKLGIDFAKTKIVRATEHIAQMQALIEAIPQKYLSHDGVYFNIADYPAYGALVKLDRSHQHHRINNDEYDKEHVADFALWKAAAPHEPSWDFEIDGQNIAGRPGWHIECSAMSTKYLGQPFDIHTGGVDLIFPHHENEIAQSSAVNQTPLAIYFIHGEHLIVDGKRMAKSLKNFYTLEDLVDKGFDPLAFRLLALQANYRSPLNFSWKSLSAAQANLLNLRAWADWVFQPVQKKLSEAEIAAAKSAITKHLGNDLDSPSALAVFNKLTDIGGPTKEILEFLDLVFGLNLAARHDINAEHKALISERELARRKNDWSRADQLRQQLQAEGLLLRDTDNGPIWQRQ